MTLTTLRPQACGGPPTGRRGDAHADARLGYRTPAGRTGATKRFKRLMSSPSSPRSNTRPDRCQRSHGRGSIADTGPGVAGVSVVAGAPAPAALLNCRLRVEHLLTRWLGHVGLRGDRNRVDLICVRVLAAPRVIPGDGCARVGADRQAAAEEGGRETRPVPTCRPSTSSRPVPPRLGPPPS